ncbi:phage holin family protein [Chryseobacterium sp. NFX27]|uniref:phage holin family protein n=1 Tax=Chryseobacterium sp. NFX27 TaxID=2819618 RepID=UPI003CEE7C95
MKTINYILKLMGFLNVSDFLGKYHPLFGGVFASSLTFGIITGFIETHSGISILLWIFFAAGTLFDLLVGLYTNLIYLKLKFESDRFFRGIFKPFVMFVVIFLTNTFKRGLENSHIKPELLEDLAVYMTATIHYSFVITIGVFILLSIAENMAKMDIRAAVTLTKILNMKIKKLEKFNDENDIDNAA